MRKRIPPTLFALFLAAGPALAQFEGVLEMKMTTATKEGEEVGGGTIKVAVAKAGTRCEMNMDRGPMAMKVVVLQKNDVPDMVYNINDAEKMYSEIDLAKGREMASQQQAPKEYTVEKLGQDTLLGYQTQHVLVKEKKPGPGATTTELWTAKDLLSYEVFSNMQARRGKGNDGAALVKALKDAGADGLPLKSITTTAGGSKVTMEVVSVQKQSLPASTFEIPAGYTKAAGGAIGMGGMSGPQSDEAKKKMQEALKNLSPEQREQIEKMMKQRQGGSQP